MKRFLIFLLGSIAGFVGGGYLLWQNPQQFDLLRKGIGKVQLTADADNNRQELADELGEQLSSVDGTKFINAALETEQGNFQNFDLMIYELGQQLNESVEESLQLSPEAKAEMDRLLAENYPEIAAQARKEYLKKIGDLKNPVINNVTSTAYTTRAEVLADALNATVCSFSTLIFIPLNLHFSLPANIAAAHFFQSPCEVLLSGVMGYIGKQLYRSGLIKDLEVTSTQLKLHKSTALAELATSQMDIQVTSSHTVTRSIGNKRWTLGKWQGAKLTIQYDVSVKYGCDLTDSFEIVRDDKQRTITVVLPEPKLLNIILEPTLTDVNDGGIPDLDSDDFRTLFTKAQNDAIHLAEKKGIKRNAQTETQTILSYVFAPFTANSQYPYQLKFAYSNLTQSTNQM